MRRIALIAVCLAMLCLAALLVVWVYAKRTVQSDAPVPEGNISAPAKKILEENPYYLRADKRLQVSFNVESKHPKLARIIAKLRETTGLDIAVDENLHDHDPDYGYIQPGKGGYYAWQIMEMVAKKDLQNGYWEKIGEGYRLAGTSVAAAKSQVRTRPAVSASRRSLPWRLLLTGVFLVVTLVLIVIRLRGIGGANSPSKPELPVGKSCPPQNE
ncbi:MAG TPA: hypothetical protein VH682_28490 [Gemmataceae bacterium]|jgi:uncharacterized oligopeptide transporter (OPT) family protein